MGRAESGSLGNRALGPERHRGTRLPAGPLARWETVEAGGVFSHHFHTFSPSWRSSATAGLMADVQHVTFQLCGGDRIPSLVFHRKGRATPSASPFSLWGQQGRVHSLGLQYSRGGRKGPAGPAGVEGRASRRSWDRGAPGSPCHCRNVFC